MDQSQDYSNYFAEGKIIEINDNILQVESPNGILQVVLSPKSNIWKGRNGVSATSLQTGDFFYARGKKSDVQLEATVIWVNIVNLTGEITNRSGDVLHLKDPANASWKVIMSDVMTEFFQGSKINGPAGKEQVKVNVPVQVIGVWDEGNQHVSATRIFTPVDTPYVRPSKPIQK